MIPLIFQVIIIGHHPPGRSDFIVQFSRWLTDLHLEFSDVIVLHVAGHTHKDEFKLVGRMLATLLGIFPPYMNS